MATNPKLVQKHLGGSFAPPLSDKLLGEYEKLATDTGGPVGEAMQTLLRCCRKWWELPDSSGASSRKHPAGVGLIVDLDKSIADTLDEHIPWTHELDAIQLLFDGISHETSRDLRNAAFHLLWHVRELDLGREPLTTDKL